MPGGLRRANGRTSDVSQPDSLRSGVPVTFPTPYSIKTRVAVSLKLTATSFVLERNHRKLFSQNSFLSPHIFPFTRSKYEYLAQSGLKTLPVTVL